jgi:hypothetical protein
VPYDRRADQPARYWSPYHLKPDHLPEKSCRGLVVLLFVGLLAHIGLLCLQTTVEAKVGAGHITNFEHYATSAGYSVAVAGRGSAASSLPWLDNIASSIYRVLCPLFTTLRSGRLARRNIPTECHPPNSFKVEFVPATKSANVNSPTFNQPTTGGATATPVAVSNQNSSPSNTTKGPLEVLLFPLPPDCAMLRKGVAFAFSIACMRAMSDVWSADMRSST